MIIQAARELGMEVVPEGGSLFMMNMTQIADGHTTIEHSLPVANIYDDVLQLWRGVGDRLHARRWSSPTAARSARITGTSRPRCGTSRSCRAGCRAGLIDALAPAPVMIPEEEDNLIVHRAPAKRISDLGIPVSIGAHGQREGLGAHWDMWIFALGGMTQHRGAARPPPSTRRARYGLDRDLGIDRAGQARRPRRARRQPARQHPQLDQHRATPMADGVLLDRNMQTSRRRHAPAPSPSGSSSGAGVTLHRRARPSAVPHED